MRESQLQTKIITDLSKLDWYTLKLIQTNRNGIPDLFILKNGRFAFLEVKTEVGKITELQNYRIKELQKYSAEAYIIKGWDEYVDFKNMIKI